MANQLRTSAFRITPDDLGIVHAYRFGAAFHDAWHRRRRELSRRGGDEESQLPYGSLANALSVISGDFVRIKPWVTDRDPYFLMTRAAVSVDAIRKAFIAWEGALWPDEPCSLYALVDACEHAEIRVADHVRWRRGASPYVHEKWLWDVGQWAIAHRLASMPLQLDTGEPTPLALDTDATLLTWERLVGLERAPLARAMHKIVPRIITLPGVEDLLLHLDCSLTRFSRKWTGAEKYAWAWRGPDRLVVRAAVAPVPNSKTLTMAWADRDTAVLSQFEALPEPASVPRPTGDAPIRATPPFLKSGYPLGTGPGQMFFEVVAQHARRAIDTLTPLEYTAARGRLRSFDPPASVSPDSHPSAFPANSPLVIVCVYASDEARERMARSLKTMLGVVPAPDASVADMGGLSVVFTRPPDAHALLLEENGGEAAGGWFASARDTYARGGGPVAFLIQTPRDHDEFEGASDPKHQIRRLLAARGATAQFLAHAAGEALPAENKEDHAAKNAVWDLLRGAGRFPVPFPAPRVPQSAPLWLVGVSVVQQRGKNKADRIRRKGRGFVLSMTATRAGAHDALGFDCAARRWEPLGKANAAFLATDHNAREYDVKATIDEALNQLLTRYPSDNALVFLEAESTRRLWGGLGDGGDGLLPGFVNDTRVSLVRVRTEKGEIPRPAGQGEWDDPVAPGLTNKLMKISGAEGNHACYYVTPPRVAAAKGGYETLRQTRFQAQQGARPEVLADNWQAASATEFLAGRGGVVLCEYAAELCRASPTWNGILRLPVPLHIARCIIDDHPDRYTARPDDEQADDTPDHEARSTKRGEVPRTLVAADSEMR
jgi:hypothetical protein